MRLSTSHLFFVLAALAVLGFADPVFAAAHGEEKSGLDFTGIKRWDLGIYTLVVFGLLVVILYVFAWPGIKQGLEKREATILGEREQAKRDRAEALEALTRAKADLDAAALKAKELLDEARRDADALRATEREAGVKDAADERQRAQREIAAAKDAALKEIYGQAVALAAMISEKALQRNISAEDHRRLLDESIAELKGVTSKA
ncbi:---NA--- : ATP synthase subunit b OS=Isosphaera pallida (strain ATCC 43644 / DSM 9630 / IS1B) GN=atpF PE=3 SV=1: ATP-synt_B [Gemmataceae bacterium]|nr:---NA--- : ATP synthase subunit b OS=Isosphaera pallida (strain ATCC 43644 / DSM 9630 / IS1B) GN=atpF PE=3 SV=1: ATP-synt_B [Gemmataceae bacterium]VTT97665.1 ---NA--- : ATP synthase subunit b OS=Isosphaera pallida (strain ATCC 43644 / DSM 9630 / IS1B) GN=atpF PE=3 SV=1: ATP-synt_B [Gemmataceae bacterium]